jgi:site-specific recombinase XerC
MLDSALGRLTLDKVRPSHVEGWGVQLRRKKLAESTIRTAYTVLRAVLDTAVQDGAIGVNPAAAIRRAEGDEQGSRTSDTGSGRRTARCGW